MASINIMNPDAYCLDYPMATSCLAKNPILLATIPLIYLLTFAIIIPLIQSRKQNRKTQDLNNPDERAPLLGHSTNTSPSTNDTEEWETDPSKDFVLNSNKPDWFVGNGVIANGLKWVGILGCVGMVSLTGQWGYAHWVASSGSGHDQNHQLVDFVTGSLVVVQQILAFALFVINASPKPQPTSGSTIPYELAKRAQRKVLLHLSAFFSISMIAWIYIYLNLRDLALDKCGDMCGYMTSLMMGFCIVYFVLAAVSMLARAVVPLGFLQRTRVNGIVPSPETDASWISLWTFSWFDPMMSYGYKNALELKDLPNVQKPEQMDTNLADYHILQQQKRYIPKNQHKVPLLKSIWILNQNIIVFQFGLEILSTALYFSGPYFLNLIVVSLENPGSVPAYKPYLYVFGILVGALARFAIEGQAALIGRKIGIRIRNLLSGLIYKKSLRRVPKLAMEENAKKGAAEASASVGASVGKIVNLMSVDAGNVGEWAGLLYTPVITFAQIVLCVGSLCYVLGWPALAGVAMMIILMVSGAPLASSINKNFYEVKLANDKRVNATNELLQGIKIIKLFAWEKQFYQKIDVLREKEIMQFAKAIMLALLNRVLWYSAPILTTFVTFAAFTKLAGRDLDASAAFTSLALFNLLRGPLQ
ncbi:hypothetical protein HDU76_005505, partial [Blyttiomyces sp. JEL0837]